MNITLNLGLNKDILNKTFFFLLRNLAMGLTLFKLQKGFLWHIASMAIFSKLISYI